MSHPSAGTPALTDHILDTALALAEQRSWEVVRLHEVARAAGLSLEEIRQHFREKDELIDAWLDRADAAMLAVAANGQLTRLSTRQRLHRLIMAWLDSMEPRRRVTREMILAKAEPGHLHIQIPVVMRISRTVQWIREAACLRDSHLHRALAETVVTGIYLAAFLSWLADSSPGSDRTRRRLDALLAAAERAALAIPGFARDADLPREVTRG